MNTRLYGQRGRSDTEPDAARQAIEANGGDIVTENTVDAVDGPPRTQFVVRDGDDVVWYFNPLGPGGTYTWMQVGHWDDVGENWA